MDEYSQEFPDYSVAQEGYEEAGFAQGTNKRKASGKLSKEGERRKKARYRDKHRNHYNAYMRSYMARRRAAHSGNGMIAEGQ